MIIERAVIAGGKTGGHLYPGIAVAEEILARNPAAAVTFVGTRDGLESRVLPRLGLPLETVTVSRLKGGGLLDRLLGLVRVPRAMVQSWRLLRRHRPQVVLGVGGYASGPAVLAAWLARYPTAIQEQNAFPGFTNRVLARVVACVFLGFEAAARHFRARRAVTTGNPIRRALADALAAADARRAGDHPGFHVLVFGGSQGARFLNEQVPAALLALHAAHPGLGLTATHQTGEADEEATRARYAGTPLEGRVAVTPYLHDMPAAYAAADVAICRAGALTVAELTAVGLPALLVPFPFAADNHQEANARVVVEAGAGRMARQPEWRSEEVAAWLAEVATTPGRREAMSEAARRLARPDAAARLVDELEGMAR